MITRLTYYPEGTTPKKLIHSELWWQGPSWLGKQKDAWPSQQNRPLVTDLHEIKTNHNTQQTQCMLGNNSAGTSTNLPNILFSRWSDDLKLFRITSYILRFIQNCRNKQNKIVGPISCIEQKKSFE